MKPRSAEYAVDDHEVRRSSAKYEILVSLIAHADVATRASPNAVSTEGIKAETADSTKMNAKDVLFHQDCPQFHY